MELPLWPNAGIYIAESGGASLLGGTIASWSMDRSGKYIFASIRELRSHSDALNLAVCEKIYPRCGDWSLWKSPFAGLSRISTAVADSESVPGLFIMHRETRAMHQASAVNAFIYIYTYIYLVEYVRGKRARYCTSARILFARSRCSGASFLFSLPLFSLSSSPDTRRQENILRNITLV